MELEAGWEVLGALVGVEVVETGTAVVRVAKAEVRGVAVRVVVTRATAVRVGGLAAGLVGAAEGVKAAVVVEVAGRVVADVA